MTRWPPRGEQRPTLQEREALLAEVQSEEQTLRPVRGADGDFSVLLSAVRRVLDDIKRPTHTQRQWEGQVSAVAALQPQEEADALSFERQAEKERDPLAVELGLREVLKAFDGKGAEPRSINELATGTPDPRRLPQCSTEHSANTAPRVPGPLADGRLQRTPVGTIHLPSRKWLRRLLTGTFCCRQADVQLTLGWLLRHELIVQVWPHYYLAIPTHDSAAEEATSDESRASSPRTPRGSDEASSLSDSAAAAARAQREQRLQSLGGTTAEGAPVTSEPEPEPEPATVERQRTAAQAGLSMPELDALEALAEGTGSISRPGRAELAVFLRWCPLLRRGCRALDLVRAAVVRRAVAADETPILASSALDDVGGGSALLHITERQQVEQLLTLFRPCLVVITHPAHADAINIT